MTTIQSLRAQLNNVLDDKAIYYGETSELDQEKLDDVSSVIDNVNETNNPNLPERPHA